MITIYDLEAGKIYRCKTRRGLLKINRITELYYTTFHITEIHPETPFVFLELDKTNKHLKVLTSDGMIGHICIFNNITGEFDIEKVVHQ